MKKEKTEKKRRAPKDYSAERNTPKSLLLDFLVCMAGSFLYGAGVVSFISSNDISSGGITGLAILANHLWRLPTGVMAFALNVPLFIAALFILGRMFVIKTIITTAMTSVFIDTGIYYLPVYEGDKLLAAIFGGVLMGLGLGLIFTRGSTSGGTDILSRLLKKKFPQASMGSLLMLCDFCVALLAGVVYKNIESILYATIVFFLSGQAVDFILYGVNKGKMLMIITDKADEISKAIISETTRGVSVLPVKGAYSGEEKHMLLCVVKAGEVSKIRRIASSIDKRTFVIISDASEVLGLGFRHNE